jgi:tRNA(fMet)-specific endonuclease VapC
MPALAYDARAAEWHARERVRLEAAGRPMPYADGQIAAIAMVNGLTLVTANVRDFRRVDGLRVEDWRT